MKVLFTGSNGQLGQALRLSLPQSMNGEPLELIATSRQGGDGMLALDLSDGDACQAAVLEHRPDWVLNAGAYTAVDRAETDSEQALRVNGAAPRAFADALLMTGGRLLQVNTDFVFSGDQGHPYQPEQTRAPLGVYGASKAAGEQAVEQLLGLGVDGHGAILLTMLHLHRDKASQGESLAVVADQVGCPTSAVSLAGACRALIARRLSGVLHWSDAGVASWYDFAVAIGELAQAKGLLEQSASVRPISTKGYPTPARRPAYSLLDSCSSRERLGLEAQHWRAALQEVIADVGA